MDNLDAAVVNALAGAVVTIWPITPPARLAPLTGGVNNLVYRVETSASPAHVLRVYHNHADVDRVRHEVALLAVPTPLATRMGVLCIPSSWRTTS